MKTYVRVSGVAVVLLFVVFCLPAFGSEQDMGSSELKYASIIDKEIAKYEAKIELDNSGSAKLQIEALDASMMLAFLKNYKKELIAEMKRRDTGTENDQIRDFLNEMFLDLYASAWLQYCCVVKDPERP